MITVTGIFKALKNIDTNGFETNLKKILHCLNVPPPGSRLAISWHTS
jgi:hypothetical protein